MIFLSQLYANYKLYPISAYGENSPVAVWQTLFPNDHYSISLQEFFKLHTYRPMRRGADLPYWGKKYFSKEIGQRVMIVTQDSRAKDAGSVAVFAHLFSLINNANDYLKYTSQLDNNQSFNYSNWNNMKQTLISWGLDFDFLFVTDASKVYKQNSWLDGDFDMVKSKELLEAEIQLCNPDLLILLGEPPLSLLDNRIKYKSYFESPRIISICDKKCVVAPLPIGQGRTQQNFQDKMQVAIKLIHEVTK